MKARVKATGEEITKVVRCCSTLRGDQFEHLPTGKRYFHDELEFEEEYEEPSDGKVKNFTVYKPKEEKVMEKFMLELELRYREVKNGDDHYRTPKIVIGIYDSWDEAEKVGNEVIRNCLANHFTIRDKFVKNYVYGMPNNLICNHGSDGKPSVFFAIRKLNMTTDVETFVTDAIAKYEAYKEWYRNQTD